MQNLHDMCIQRTLIQLILSFNAHVVQILCLILILSAFYSNFFHIVHYHYLLSTQPFEGDETPQKNFSFFSRAFLIGFALI